MFCFGVKVFFELFIYCLFSLFMNTLKKAINKLINCTEEEVSTVGEGGTTGDHCYGDQWPVWAVSQPPPVPVVSTAHSLVPAAHYLPGTGWAGCGVVQDTVQRGSALGFRSLLMAQKCKR